MTVVDALPALPYGQRHLPRALNAAIVTDSTNAFCGRGEGLAARLEALGYTDVRVHRAGIADWVNARLPLE
ncbi:hypothetical protein [Phytohabitans rumicis]|uniref:Sulfurtransferase n=1 Tax=Phytohabitans rumicis TaxID=1076125 RepID=A0A6V8LGY7_9ACTN|nr:hypothetical protein [Phytohabitans rumicis]GFJ94168.1 sulfurtransferase [Phytohabitans rumicis]